MFTQRFRNSQSVEYFQTVFKEFFNGCSANPFNRSGLYHLFFVVSTYNQRTQAQVAQLLEAAFLLFCVLGKSRKFNDVFLVVAGCMGCGCVSCAEGARLRQRVLAIVGSR